MSKVKYSLPIVLAAALLAGCGGGGSSAKLGGDDIAVVGGQHVTLKSFNDLLARAKKSYQQQGQKFPKEGTTQFTTVKGQVVSLLVQEAEREQEAASMGIKVTDKDVENRLNQIKKQYFGGNEKKYQAQLKKQGITDAAVRSDVKAQLISEAIFNKVTKNVKVSQKEIDDYYKSHLSQYQQPESRDVRYILVGKSKALAESVYHQLVKGGDKAWCTLAKKYAKDSSGQNCGKATFSKGQTVKVFDTTAFSAPANKVHAPFYDPTQYKAWFVVEPLGPVKPKSTTPEKQVSSTIQQQLLQTKKNQAMTDWASNLTKHYCGGSRVKYQPGYAPSPDPCTATNTVTT
jgi:SurA-like protein/parvulin-like peptidyl-prolyl cis-trans isomerase-like protein